MHRIGAETAIPEETADRKISIVVIIMNSFAFCDVIITVTPCQIVRDLQLQLIVDRWHLNLLTEVRGLAE